MPILYNKVVDNVSALVNIVKGVSGIYGVVAVTKQDPLTINNPSKKPTLLIIFVVGESHDTVINTVFPLCYPAKLPRIVVWLKRGSQTMPTYKDALATISCNATINSRTGVYTATPSESQKQELEAAIKKWIKNPTPFRFVHEIKVAFFEHWFRTDESLRKGVKIGRQICRQLAIEGYASQIKDDKNAIGIVTWDAGSTKLDEDELLTTLERKGCQFGTFVLVLINWRDFYFPNTSRVLACVKAKSDGYQGFVLDEFDMGQVIKVIVSVEEKRMTKSKDLPQQGRTLDTKQAIEEKPIASQISDQDFNDIISETVDGKLENDIDRIRDWLGAVRWKPLPATAGISKYEQYARMQALPDKEIPPLLKALEDMVGTDWRIVELQKTVDRLLERLKQKEGKPQEPNEEFKGTKEQESKTAKELQQLREQITRQEKVISDLQNQKVQEKCQMDEKMAILISNLEKSLASERTASEQMRKQIVDKLKPKVPLLDAKGSLETAVDQVLETWKKQEAELQAELKQRIADLAVKEKRIAEFEAKAQQAVEAKVPDDELKRQNEQLLQKEATLQTELKAKEQRLAELEAKEQRLEQENDVLKSRVKDLEKTLKEEEDFDVKAVLTDEQKRWAEDSFLLADLRYALHQNASLDTIKKLANPNLQPRDVSDIIDQIPNVERHESKKEQ